MSVQFTMVGKLSLPKETDKFKNYEEKEYTSGWVNKTLKFNLLSNDNRFMLQSKGGFMKNGKGEIYVFSKDYVDENGKRVKGEGFRIPWKERLTHPRLPEVAEFKKFVVDLEENGFRRELNSAINKVKEGQDLTEAEVAKFGASDVKGLEAALEKSNKKRKEFIAEADFAEFMYKVITSGKYADRKFKITGSYDMQCSEANGKWYNNYVPQRVYLAADDEPEVATATVTLFYGEGAVEDAKEEKGKYYISAYTQVYDSNKKANVFAPYNIVIDANDNEKKVAKLVSYFETEEDTVKTIGVVVDLLDGAQRKKIEIEDLDEETQENILFGLTTLEDVVRELGGNVYGERITENRFKKLAQGYSKGAEDSAYTPDDLIMKVQEEVEVVEEADEETEDLFDEDDDLFN